MNRFPVYCNYRVGQKIGATTFDAPHFLLSLRLQNASNNFYDFWHMSTPFHSVASLDSASEKLCLDLALGGATHFINLFNIELTDVFRITECLSKPKITQIGSGVLKM